MRAISLNQITGIILLLCLLNGCTNTNRTQQYSTPQHEHQLTDISHLSDREKADLYQSILSADIAGANGEFEIATSYYLAAGRLSKSTDLLKLAIDSATKADDQLAIFQSADIWLSIEPKNIAALIYKINSSLFLQDIETALSSADILINLEKNQRQLAAHLEKATKSLSPPVTNAFYTELNGKYPDSLAIIYSRAAFFARVAKLTKQPAQMTGRALAMLNQLLAEKADFIPALELKIRLLYQAHQDEKAEALLRNLHSQYPDSSEISHLLGQLLYDLHKYDLAKQHYRHWVKTNKNDDEARFYLAASHFALAEYQQSLDQYRKILGSDYKTQSVYFFCGNAASQLKQLDQAAACYNLVAEGQHLTRAKIELAKIYALQGKIDKALKTVRTPGYAVNEKSQIQLINIEVEILNRHVNKDQARQRLESAIKDHPDNVSLLFRKISVEELQDKSEPLVELFEKAEKLITDEKKKHQFNLSTANFLRTNHHYQQAVDWLTTALEAKPNDQDYIYARALHKEPLGLVDEMIDDFRQLLQQDPNNANLQNALGYSLADLNQELEYAESLIQKAYIAMPENAAVIDSLGWLAFRKGETNTALKYLNRAFKLSPSADIATHIGEVYWSLGEKQKAIKFWLTAQSMDKDNYLLKNTIDKYDIELNRP